ncbi:MAG: hypothetical protein GX787_06170, partial [Tissierellia bacterium]|nr:hypothetical protein [Tissierellia bacterium]
VDPYAPEVNLRNEFIERNHEKIIEARVAAAVKAEQQRSSKAKEQGSAPAKGKGGEPEGETKISTVQQLNEFFDKQE